MRHKVIFFSPVGFFKGGAENSLQDLLGNQGVDPVLVVPEEGSLAVRAREKKVPVISVSFGRIEKIHRPLKALTVLGAGVDLVRAGWALRTLGVRNGVRCVHSNGMKAHMIAGVARLMGGAPVVCHVRDIPYTRVEKLVWQAMALFAAKVVLVSRACWPAKELPKNVVVVPNGIAVPEVKLPPAPAKGMPLRIGFTGRIDPIKGLDMLLEWVAAARDAGMNLTLTVRGGAVADHPNYPELIESKARALGLDEKVCRFEGKVSGLTEIYKDVDVVVIPSKVPDPLPRSVMEAMAMGVPVMGYPAGGIPDQINDKVDGFLVKDADDFMAACRLLQDKDTWLAMQKAGRARVARDFTLPRLYENLERVYGGLKK